MKAETAPSGKRLRVGADFEQRTLAFAIEVIRFSETLPASTTARVVLQQLVRSATAVGANYREANRAESKADFIHKVGIPLKEAAETEYWLQICATTPLGSAAHATSLRAETDELIAILTTIKRKAAGS